VSLSRVRDACSVVASIVGDLQPDAVPLPEAPVMWEELDRIERLTASAKTLLARRVDESLEWKRKGFRSAAEHLAAMGGTTIGEARDALTTSKLLPELPRTHDALRAGALSSAQTSSVATAAAADPGAESRLLDAAASTSLAELRQECLRTKANADPDRDATYRRIGEQRRLRTWTDAEGGWNLVARGTPDAGARVMAALEPLIDARFCAARTSGAREAREAYAFDSLVDLAERVEGPASKPAATRRRPRHLALLRIDLEALRRGRTRGDELCELSGIGPIPVTRARDLLGESTLRLVITKGVNVANVTHLGRGPTAAQRIALLWASPTCSVEGCTRTRVEIDHRHEWAKGGRTQVANLDPLCSHHHARKTIDGWALVGDAGKRRMVPPGDPGHPRRSRARRGPP
jgi:hypothetical protein